MLASRHSIDFITDTGHRTSSLFREDLAADHIVQTGTLAILLLIHKPFWSPIVRKVTTHNFIVVLYLVIRSTYIPFPSS